MASSWTVVDMTWTLLLCLQPIRPRGRVVFHHSDPGYSLQFVDLSFN